MIRQVSGYILLSKARVIAHGVAPNDDHAQGLVNDTTASTLSGELLNFSGAIGGSD